MAAPILKWAGGKRKLLDQIKPHLSADIDRRRYIEPFFGGGALFFDLEPQRALLNDLNAELVTTYLAVQQDVEGVIERLRRLLEAPMCRETFEAHRRIYNNTRCSIAGRAALLLYLNKTCFNGLYRVNKSGEFNVPFGKYKNPKVLDESALRLAHNALQGARIESMDYKSLVLCEARAGDFIYFDPPYAPVSETSSFVTYTKEAFGWTEQRQLFDVFEELHSRGCKLMISNSYTPELLKLWTSTPYSVCRTISAPRAINSKGDKRGAVKELLVTNY